MPGKNDKKLTLWKRIERNLKQQFRNTFTIDGEHNTEFVKKDLIETIKKNLQKKLRSPLNVESTKLSTRKIETIEAGFKEYQEQVNDKFNSHPLARFLGARNLLTVKKDKHGNILDFEDVTAGAILLNALKAWLGIDENTAAAWKNIDHWQGRVTFALKFIPHFLLWNLPKSILGVGLKVLTLFTEAVPDIVYSFFKSLTEHFVYRFQKTWNKPATTWDQKLEKGLGLIIWSIPIAIFGAIAAAAKIVQFVGKAITSPMQSFRRYWNMDPSVMPSFLNASIDPETGKVKRDLVSGDIVYPYPNLRKFVGKFLALLSGATSIATYVIGGFFAAKGILLLSTTSSMGITPLHPVAKAGVDLAANGITAAAELTTASTSIGTWLTGAYSTVSTFVATNLGVTLPALGLAAPVVGVGAIAGTSTVVVGSATSIIEEKIADSWHANALRKVFEWSGKRKLAASGEVPAEPQSSSTKPSSGRTPQWILSRSPGQAAAANPARRASVSHATSAKPQGAVSPSPAVSPTSQPASSSTERRKRRSLSQGAQASIPQELIKQHLDASRHQSSVSVSIPPAPPPASPNPVSKKDESTSRPKQAATHSVSPAPVATDLHKSHREKKSSQSSSLSPQPPLTEQSSQSEGSPLAKSTDTSRKRRKEKTNRSVSTDAPPSHSSEKPSATLSISVSPLASSKYKHRRQSSQKSNDSDRKKSSFSTASTVLSQPTDETETSVSPLNHSTPLSRQAPLLIPSDKPIQPSKPERREKRRSRSVGELEGAVASTLRITDRLRQEAAAEDAREKETLESAQASSAAREEEVVMSREQLEAQEREEKARKAAEEHDAIRKKRTESQGQSGAPRQKLWAIGRSGSAAEPRNPAGSSTPGLGKRAATGSQQ